MKFREYIGLFLVGTMCCSTVWAWTTRDVAMVELRTITGMSATDLKAQIAESMGECKTMPLAKRADWWTVKK